MIRRSVPLTTFLINLPALFLCLLFMSCDSVKLSLRYRTTKGTTYRYVVTHDWHNVSATRRSTSVASLSGSIWISLTIDSIRGNGEIVCTGTVDSASLKFGSVFGKDTSGVQGFFGKRVRMSLSSNGKTLGIVPIDSLPTGKTPRAYDQFSPLRLLPTVFVKLPEQPLGMGDTWEDPLQYSSESDSINSTIHGGTKYRLVGAERVGSHECIRLALDGTITGHTTGRMVQGRESGSEYSVTTSGVAYFALQEGVMASMEITVRSKAASTVKQLPWSTEGMLKRQVRLLE